jgi:hypothetical protein
MRAKQRAGQMIDEGKKAGVLNKTGNPTVTGRVPLKDVGITKKESASYQQLAKVSEPKFEKAIETVKKRDGVLTEAVVVIFQP